MVSVVVAAVVCSGPKGRDNGISLGRWAGGLNYQRLRTGHLAQFSELRQYDRFPERNKKKSNLKDLFSF